MCQSSRSAVVIAVVVVVVVVVGVVVDVGVEVEGLTGNRFTSRRVLPAASCVELILVGRASAGDDVLTGLAREENPGYMHSVLLIRGVRVMGLGL